MSNKNSTTSLKYIKQVMANAIPNGYKDTSDQIKVSTPDTRAAYWSNHQKNTSWEAAQRLKNQADYAKATSTKKVDFLPGIGTVSIPSSNKIKKSKQSMINAAKLPTLSRSSVTGLSSNSDKTFAAIGKQQQLSKQTKTTGTSKSGMPSTGSLTAVNPDVMNSDESKLINWSQTGYKMSADEKKEAKEILSRYFAQNNLLALKGKQQSASDYQIQQAAGAVQNKISTGSNFMAGILGAFPLTQKLSSALAGKVTGDTNVANEFNNTLNTMKSNAASQNPIAYGAGTFAGKSAQYALTNELLGLSPIANAANNAGNKIASAIPGLSTGAAQTVGGHIGNLMTGQLADTVLDTIPTEILNAQNGMNKKDIAIDTLKNQGVNALFNVGAEGISSIPELKNYFGSRLKDGQVTGDIAASSIPYLKNDGITTSKANNLFGANSDEILPSLAQSSTRAGKVSVSPSDAATSTIKTVSNIADDNSAMSAAKQAYSINMEKAVKNIDSVFNNFNIQKGSQLDTDITELKNSISALTDDPTREGYVTAMKRVENAYNTLNTDITSNGGLKGISVEPDYAAKEAFSNIKNAVKGKKILLTDDILAELNDESVTSLRNKVYTGKSGTLTFSKSSGTPIDTIFDEIDKDTGYAVSSFMRQNNLDPDVKQSQVKGLVDYIQSIKNKYNVNVPIEYSESDLRDMWNELLDSDGQKSFADYVTGIKNTDSIASASKTSVPVLNNVDTNASEIPTKLSKVRSNTMQNSGIFTDDELVNQYTKEMYKYVPESEKTTFEQAAKNVADDPEGMLAKYTAEGIEDKKMNGTDVDTMMQLISKYNKEAEAVAESNPELSQQLYGNARNLSLTLRKTATERGQFIEAFKKYSHTADGAIQTGYATAQKDILDYSQKYAKASEGINKISASLYQSIENNGYKDIMASGSDAEKQAVRQQIADEFNNLLKGSDRQTQKAIKSITSEDIDSILSAASQNDLETTLKLYAATGSTGIKSSTIQKVSELFSKAETYGEKSKARYDLESQAYTLIANDIYGKGQKFSSKVDAWRYMSMLANPTTHIKNIAGNALFGEGLTGVKNTLASIIESTADHISKAAGGNGIDRTKSILTANDSELVKACRQDALDNAFTDLSGSKFEDVHDAIKDAANIWNNQGVGKVLNKLYNINMTALSKEDEAAGLLKYKTALAGYIKANGYDASIFTDESDTAKAFLEEARNYAVNSAKEATFHQDNIIASDFSNFVKNLRSSDNAAARTVGTAFDVTVPFKKTPANILASIWNYSPTGALNILADAKKLYNGSINASKLIDDVAKTTTGTGAMAIGGLLAYAGLIKSGYTESDPETNFDKTTGGSGTVFKLGDKTYSIDEFSPASTPLIMGAAIYESKKNSKNDGISALLGSTAAAANSVVDMTMLSGIAQTLSSIRGATDDSKVLQNVATQIAGNYASQMLPTLGYKTAKAIDDTARTTYSGKTGIAKTVEQNANFLTQKIPGLQKLGENMSDSSNATIASIGNSLKNEPSIDLWGRERKNVGGNFGGRLAYNMLSPGTYSKDTSNKVDTELKNLYNKTQDKNVLPSLSTSEATIDDTKLTPEEWTKYQKDKGTLSHDLVSGYVNSTAYKDDTDSDKASMLKSLYSYAKDATKANYGYELSSSEQLVLDAYKHNGSTGAINEIRKQSALRDNGFSVASNTAAEIYEKGGIPMLKQYDSYKTNADTNKNGSVSGKEAEALLNKQNLTRSQKAYWYSKMCPKVKNNPFK